MVKRVSYGREHWTPGKVRNRLKRYIEECTNRDYLPLDRDLVEVFNIPVGVLRKWYNGEAPYGEYADVMKELSCYQEEYLVRHGLEDPKMQSFYIFMLKQKKYGGYTDKQEHGDAAVKVDVTINGAGSNPFA